MFLYGFLVKNTIVCLDCCGRHGANGDNPLKARDSKLDTCNVAMKISTVRPEYTKLQLENRANGYELKFVVL